MGHVPISSWLSIWQMQNFTMWLELYNKYFTSVCRIQNLIQYRIIMGSSIWTGLQFDVVKILTSACKTAFSAAIVERVRCISTFAGTVEPTCNKKSLLSQGCFSWYSESLRAGFHDTVTPRKAELCLFHAFLINGDPIGMDVYRLWVSVPLKTVPQFPSKCVHPSRVLLLLEILSCWMKNYAKWMMKGIRQGRWQLPSFFFRLVNCYQMFETCMYLDTLYRPFVAAIFP